MFWRARTRPIASLCRPGGFDLFVGHEERGGPGHVHGLALAGQRQQRGGPDRFSDSSAVGRGNAHPNQITTQCSGVFFEGPASEFFGTDLPEGVAATDTHPGRIRGQDHHQALRRRQWRRADGLPARERAPGRGSRREEDGDIHLVVRDKHPSHTIIVELPNVACRGTSHSVHKAEMANVRHTFALDCGLPGWGTRVKKSGPKDLSGKATLEGVGFFDLEHPTPQSGVAPNNIELHPLLSFVSSNCRVTS